MLEAGGLDRGTEWYVLRSLTANIIGGEDTVVLRTESLVGVLLAHLGDVVREFILASREFTGAACSCIKILLCELALVGDGPWVWDCRGQADESGNDCECLHLDDVTV